MGRPKNADAATTRLRILEAAIRRFGTQGLRATSLRQIAADAGVTFATVHHHFGTKDALHERCVEEGFEHLGGMEGELMEEIAKAPRTREELVAHVSGCAFRYAMRRKIYSRFLLRTTVFEPDAPNRQRLEDAQRTYLDVASRLLGPLLNRSPESLRVPLQGLMFLLTRLAVTTDRELAIIGGEPEELEDDVAQVAVATLVIS
ncbi:MAG: TetR family transcriptional regulator [Myxococcota bacterium]